MPKKGFLQQVPRMRLQAQLIHPTSGLDVAGLVSTLGAMQAQDFPMCKWGIGARLSGITEKQVNKAFDSGKIVRTHILRPTWHVVAAEDLSWMLELTAPHLIRMVQNWQKQLGITSAILKSAIKILEKNLQGDKQLTRDEISTLFSQNKIKLEDNRLAHLLIAAELNGTICSGATSANGQKYALLQERVPTGSSLHREEALARLALRYFSSRGPATLSDFSWWSGLGLGDCRVGLEQIKANLQQETVEGQTYWFGEPPSNEKTGRPLLHLLPAFDEFLISYRDRSASLAEAHQSRLLTRNGIFWPMILVNGKATGSWKRSVRKDRVVVEPEFFVPLTGTAKPALKKQVMKFAHFLGKEAELREQ